MAADEAAHAADAGQTKPGVGARMQPMPATEAAPPLGPVAVLVAVGEREEEQEGEEEEERPREEMGGGWGTPSRQAASSGGGEKV